MKAYHHTAKGEDGKLYDYYCERDNLGAYITSTMERREITDKQYIDWYNRTHRTETT